VSATGASNTISLDRSEIEGSLRGQRRLTYRPYLDGLRAVAVYLVVAFHSGLGRFRGGFIGVDVFFVLSGFLVTKLLVSDLAAYGRVRWTEFYSRRARRILPAALVTLLVTAVVYEVIASPLERYEAVGGFRAACFYVANWYFIDQAADYFAANITNSPVLHFWSLAVEEQFYLLWPLLISALYSASRWFGPRRWTALRLTVIAAGGASAIAALRIGTHDLDRAYYGTDTRAYQLLAGALLAMTPQVLRLGPAFRTAARRVAAVALVAIVVLAMSFQDLSPITRGIATVVSATALIVALENADDGWARRLLSSGPFRYLGRVSYGTYLWHWPIIILVTSNNQPTPVVLFVVAATLATTIAAVSFRVMEHPIRVTHALDRLKAPVIAVGFTASIVIGALVVPSILDRGGDTVAATGSSTSPYQLRNWRDARRDIPTAPDCVGEHVERCIVVDGDGPKVMLMGDSNALMWLPALRAIADQEDWQLSTALITTCPWQRGLLFAFLDRESFCERRWDDWYDRVVPVLDPDVVVLAERAYDDTRSFLPVRLPDGSVVKRPDKAFEERLIDLSLSEIDTLREQGRKVVVFEPIPIPQPFDPLQCLSEGKRPEKCAFRVGPHTTPLEHAFREAAERVTNLWSLDLDRVVCPRQPMCDAMVDDVIVFRDDGHLTRTFARANADALRQLFAREHITDSNLNAYVPAG
jgi:peptidoglycan/LPS O-acetylase OafA/YrhL